MSEPPIRDLLRRAWSPQGEQPLVSGTALERLGLICLILVVGWSVNGWLMRHHRYSLLMGAYHIGLVITLIFLTIGVNYVPSWLVFFILVYVVAEILSWGVYDIFIGSRETVTEGPRSDFSAFVWIVYSYSIIVWLYGIYYFRSGKIVGGPQDEALPHMVTAIYYSAVTMTTVGYGDYSPAHDAYSMQIIAISETFVGIIMIALYLSVIISSASERFRSYLSEK